MNDKNKVKLKEFNDPKPAREVSLIFPTQQLKIHTIQALREVILGVVRGAIHFQDVKIISPVKNSKN
jgi:LysR family hydrogen peroxide-inducible transcriptional activator